MQGIKRRDCRALEPRRSDFVVYVSIRLVGNLCPLVDNAIQMETRDHIVATEQHIHVRREAVDALNYLYVRVHECQKATQGMTRDEAPHPHSVVRVSDCTVRWGEMKSIAYFHVDTLSLRYTGSIEYSLCGFLRSESPVS